MLRKATSKDFAAWKAIYMQSSVNPFMAYGSVNELDDDFVNMIQKSTLYVYEDNEQNIIGICRLTPFSGDSQHVVEINSFAISEGYRGKGHAQVMLSAIIEEIKKQPQIIRIQLSVEGDNPAAQHIYQKAGFELEAIYDDWFRRYEGTHQEKWFVPENFMVKFINKPQVKPLDSIHSPQHQCVHCNLRKAKSVDFQKSYDLYQKKQQSLGLKAKSHEDFFSDFSEFLGSGDLYVYEHNDEIIGMCHLAPYSQYKRLHHSAEIDFLIMEPLCQPEAMSSFLKSIKIEQVDKGIKRIEVALLEGDSNSTEGIKQAGFEAKGELSGIIKHPQGHYVNKLLFESSLFGISDAIEFIKTCHFDTKKEQKIIKKIEILNTLTGLKNLNFENQIYQTIKKHRDNPEEILNFLSSMMPAQGMSFFSNYPVDSVITPIPTSEVLNYGQGVSS
ncbi:GNAT family N-acetyltransferase [Legionella sp. PATHC038]|uniref:GNAT family N-acetyltransferase n=1 Tax=Legionella sheltonii TaxID=2992041 RepID=UPI002243AC19|nr:GNAT family protein [Legionella sp. PATHC038]MCW8398190.1 GNAT family N-acetyltransferase [Legionella sp. PATHC038]